MLSLREIREYIPKLSKRHPNGRVFFSFLFGLLSSITVFDLVDKSMLQIYQNHAPSVVGAHGAGLLGQPWLWVLIISGFVGLFVTNFLLQYNEGFGEQTEEQEAEQSADQSEESLSNKVLEFLARFINGLGANTLVSIFFTVGGFLAMNDFFSLNAPYALIIGLGVLMGLAADLNSFVFTADSALTFWQKVKLPKPENYKDRAFRVGLVFLGLLLSVAYAAMESLTLANHWGVVAGIAGIGIWSCIMMPAFLGNFIYGSAESDEDKRKEEQKMVKSMLGASAVFAGMGLLLVFGPALLGSAALPCALFLGMAIFTIKNVYDMKKKNQDLSPKKMVLAAVIGMATFVMSVNFGLGFTAFLSEHLIPGSHAFLISASLSVLVMGALHAFFQKIFNVELKIIEKQPDAPPDGGVDEEEESSLMVEGGSLLEAEALPPNTSKDVLDDGLNGKVACKAVVCLGGFFALTLLPAAATYVSFSLLGAWALKAFRASSVAPEGAPEAAAAEAAEAAEGAAAAAAEAAAKAAKAAEEEEVAPEEVAPAAAEAAAKAAKAAEAAAKAAEAAAKAAKAAEEEEVAPAAAEEEVAPAAPAVAAKAAEEEEEEAPARAEEEEEEAPAAEGAAAAAAK